MTYGTEISLHCDWCRPRQELIRDSRYRNGLGCPHCGRDYGKDMKEVLSILHDFVDKNIFDHHTAMQLFDFIRDIEVIEKEKEEKCGTEK
jgi:hypothetical protein